MTEIAQGKLDREKFVQKTLQKMEGIYNEVFEKKDYLALELSSLYTLGYDKLKGKNRQEIMLQHLEEKK